MAGILEKGGYTVYVVQEPLTCFAADVAATRAVLDRSGPCVLMGHSWAGMIITESGAHPAVKSLVYVDAFQPQVGETAGGLQNKTPPAGGKNSLHGNLTGADRGRFFRRDGDRRRLAKRAKSETIELPAPHAVFLTHAKEIAALIEKAAKSAE